MEARIQKLLILECDSGEQLEAIDFKKVVQTIIEQYISKNDENTSKKIVQILTSMIAKIPLKQHIYGGLTAKISLISKQVSLQIITLSLSNLQSSLSSLNLYQSLNILTFFSQLMNISLLNSLTFMNILEDIADKLQTESNLAVKKFYITILVRTLPSCFGGLMEKLTQDFRKFIDLLQAHTNDDSLFNYIKKQVAKGKALNFSNMDRLQDDFTGLEQVTIKKKLKITSNADNLNKWSPVQYVNMNRMTQDELYNQFLQQQGVVYLYRLQSLIQTFYMRKQTLVTKVVNLLMSVASHKQTYLYRLALSSLLSKSLKSAHPLVQQSLLLSIINNIPTQPITAQNQQPIAITRNDLQMYLQNQVVRMFDMAEESQFGVVVALGNGVSYLVNCWRGDWPWDRFVDHSLGYLKRKVLLLLIIEKAKSLNSHFVIPTVLEQFLNQQSTQKLTNQHQYTTIQDLQIFEQFEAALKQKTLSQPMKQLIKSEHHYQIFLQCLFRRTCLSQTHLKTLIQRYKQLLIAFQEWDWTLINKIRNFWKKSYLNRQIYIQLMITKSFITYNSYVGYIGQLKDKDQIQMTWIRVELSQLNHIFGTNANKINK